MVIYTSYFGNLKNLAKEDVLPISVARFKPQFYHGLEMLELAPYPYMLAKTFPPERYTRDYWSMLRKLNPKDVVRKIESLATQFGKTKVALLCYEKNQNECHREYIAQWLNNNGYKVEEFSAKKEESKPQYVQLDLFS